MIARLGNVLCRGGGAGSDEGVRTSLIKPDVGALAFWRQVDEMVQDALRSRLGESHKLIVVSEAVTRRE